MICQLPHLTDAGIFVNVLSLIEIRFCSMFIVMANYRCTARCHYVRQRAQCHKRCTLAALTMQASMCRLLQFMLLSASINMRNIDCEHTAVTI